MSPEYPFTIVTQAFSMFVFLCFFFKMLSLCLFSKCIHNGCWHKYVLVSWVTSKWILLLDQKFLFSNTKRESMARMVKRMLENRIALQMYSAGNSCSKSKCINKLEVVILLIWCLISMFDVSKFV